MKDDVLKYISSKFQDERAAITDDLAMGKAKDHGDYKYFCGIIRGLLMANNIVIETAERMENADD
jgi:hypothetical protein